MGIIEYINIACWVIAGASMLRAFVPDIESMPVISHAMQLVRFLAVNTLNAKPLRGATIDEINAEIKRRGL